MAKVKKRDTAKEMDKKKNEVILVTEEIILTCSDDNSIAVIDVSDLDAAMKTKTKAKTMSHWDSS